MTNPSDFGFAINPLDLNIADMQYHLKKQIEEMSFVKAYKNDLMK